MAPSKSHYTGAFESYGMEFHRHYIGSAACCPSRATLFTGQYPSLHGVSQTVGVAKEAFDSDMFWLNRNTVPTRETIFEKQDIKPITKENGIYPMKI
ncbi:sulfatase-like hydrolase/transferase [Brevibacillus halotolerans]|uniref:sulfatase-like hydrolase/transferase n=1 Tax=Brevibacillus halotolerans TaxID=1507437 RepID=UPI001FE55921|nr:sulfatase-like hydrolase/transferase [Brevibacillus halotolerans]